MRQVPPTARRLDAAFGWAPTGRRAVPVIVVLVAVADLGGVGTVALLATLLTGRSVGAPLRDLRRAVQRVGAGDHEVRVPVDDAGEIGLLQEGVNTMVDGPAERERLRDLFGRHVGTTVAQQALVTGVSLGGELRAVATLFVDIAGSTSLVLRTGPERMAGLLNRFFAVVVDAVEREGGLVNEFEGTPRRASSARRPSTRTRRVRRCTRSGGSPRPSARPASWISASVWRGARCGPARSVRPANWSTRSSVTR